MLYSCTHMATVGISLVNFEYGKKLFNLIRNEEKRQ